MSFNRFLFLSLSLTSSLTFVSPTVVAETIDEYLHKQLEFFGVTKYEPLPVNNTDEHRTKVMLGRRLFMDTNLSGNKNISCLTCHHPMMGSSDNLGLSQTEDGKGVLKRNSSSLFNVGDKFNTFMFWDGRVHFHPAKKVFTTPEPALNGATPLAKNITSVMTSALSAQALFPLVSMEEMKGRKGDNEIADSETNLEAWDKIIKRITTESDAKNYVALFNRAYPDTKDNVQKINIGHAGEAMAAFMREGFYSNSSPFHNYLAGDDNAMTPQQKRGLVVFMEGGKCIACHQGNLLGNNSFFTSVGVPSYGAKPFSKDLGRAEVTGEKFNNFFFKTPSLINVALTAPYMHNGAFKTIREVLNHYNGIRKSLNTFDLSPERRKEFPVELEVLNSQADKDVIFSSIQAGFLRVGLGLSPKELDDLEVFLTEGLTDPKWVPQQQKKKF